MLFGMPLLMTMELWQLGFYVERYRLFSGTVRNSVLGAMMMQRSESFATHGCLFALFGSSRQFRFCPSTMARYSMTYSTI